MECVWCKENPKPSLSSTAVEVKGEFGFAFSICVCLLTGAWLPCARMSALAPCLATDSHSLGIICQDTLGLVWAGHGRLPLPLKPFHLYQLIWLSFRDNISPLLFTQGLKHWQCLDPVLFHIKLQDLFAFSPVKPSAKRILGPFFQWWNSKGWGFIGKKAQGDSWRVFATGS